MQKQVLENVIKYIWIVNFSPAVTVYMLLFPEHMQFIKMGNERCLLYDLERLKTYNPYGG
jgi:hypothetical protein